MGRLGELAQMRRRSAFDDDVGRFAEPCQRQYRNRPGKAGHCCFGAGDVTRRDSGERQSIDPTVEMLGDHLADRPKPADRHT